VQHFGNRNLPLDHKVAVRWGRQMATLKAAGKVTGVQDGQIAATALANNLTVITRNVKDFVHTGVPCWNIWEDESP